MGHDVHTIGRHNLDTSSIEALAKDISLRLKVNVEYGVFDKFSFDWDGLFRKPSYEYWVFGKINYPKSEKTLWLTDEFYTYHIVWGRYGEKAWQLPYFTKYESNRYELKEAVNNICFELRDNAEDEDYGTFFNDTFHNWYNYFYNRWFSFCRAFVENEAQELCLSNVNSHRKKTMDFFNLLGGSETFYFDDQGETQYLAYDYYDWESILKEVEKNFKDTTLNISEFMKHKKLLSKDDYPLAFYDDFADLKTKTD